MLILILMLSNGLVAREKVFADYFDIPVGSSPGTEVIGRIHLERNKDVRHSPIPEGYHFEIKTQDGNLFDVKTEYDLSNRIMGVFVVSQGQNTGTAPSAYHLSVLLKDAEEVVQEFEVKINIVTETLWKTFWNRYKDLTVSSGGSRMYGRRTYSDVEVEKLIAELKETNGKFKGIMCYERHPEDYLAESTIDPMNGRVYGTIEYEWEEVASRIGGLGYAYAKSAKYGPNGNYSDRMKLKEAIYASILAYTNCVPVEGDDIKVNGKPIGQYTGDGFSRLDDFKLIGHQVATHQWVVTDPLMAPGVHIMPDLLQDIRNGNEQARKVQDALIRFLQNFTSIVSGRREIRNADERWGYIADTTYSHGAWADANLGHRSRTLLALPILWADYNRPMTYVPYWYSDFYKDDPYKGFSFSPGWSPHGVVSDVRYWFTKFNIPAHFYIQSGFQPDGTISHHTGHGTDAAMIAYGFEWLTHSFVGLNQFKDTPFQLDDKFYQFAADRFTKVYAKLFYKGYFDYTIAGRSFFNDFNKFRSRSFLPAIDELIEVKSEDTQLNNEEDLLRLKKELRNGTYEYSGTTAYWVNEYLAHRRGKQEAPFYASVKLKSERVIGAEDFDRVRKSWHAGSGVLQLKVTGNEYDTKVLGNYDWHMLPGITEEWRTDPLPNTGGAQASLPGKNNISGVLSDGTNGMALYHHLPGEHYSSATALKSYYFVGEKIIGLGSDISRLKEGQGQGIYTCMDQSKMGESDLVYSVKGEKNVIKPGESKTLSLDINKPIWIHHGKKGYLVFPFGNQTLTILTGDEIKTTDKKHKSDEANFLLALGHGTNPEKNGNNQYYYMMVPNVGVKDMPGLLRRAIKNVSVRSLDDSIHAIYSAEDKISQACFFKPGKIEMNASLQITSDKPSMVMMSESNERWVISLSDPTADIDLKTITLNVSCALKPGKYEYEMPGIYPRPGEYAMVKPDGRGGSVVTVELPDNTDQEYYNYQAALYANAPVVLDIPKENTGK